MKKALLIAALATSMHASAQDLPSNPGMYHQLSNFKDNPLGGTEDKVLNTFGTTQLRIPAQLTSLQQNDSIYTWRWDTDIAGWTVEYKYINMVYDTNNLTFYTSQIFDGSAWVNDYQYFYTYDINNNLTNKRYQFWDDSTWVNSQVQYTYTYDARNNKTSELLVGASYFSYSIKWTYDANNDKTSELHETMYGAYSFTWTYDARHNIISEVYQGHSYNYTDEDNYKWKYLYDSKNNRIKETHQVWIGNDWVTDYYYRYLYTYDTNKNITSKIVQLTEAPNLYLNVNKFDYTYDAKNNLTNEIKQGWENGYWVNKDQFTFTYDDSSNLVSKSTGGWLGIAWVYYLQDLYTFDAQNNLTSHVFQELNGATWKMVDQWLYTYEDDNFKASESHKHFDLNAPETVVTGGDSTHYYFHTITTAINVFKGYDDNFIVYPNPSSGKFTISSKNSIRAIEIYNLVGEKVYADSEFYPSARIDIDLSKTGKGIYIINIYDGKLLYNRKVVVQ